MDKKVIYWGIIMFVTLCSCTSKTVDKETQAKNDSIKKYLDLAANDNLDFEKRKTYNDKAFSLLDLSKNDSLTRYNLYIVGINNTNLMQFIKLENNATRLLELSNNSNDQLKIACAYKLKGLSHMAKSENEKAIDFFYKSKKIFLKLKDVKSLITVERDIALVQSYSCDFLGSNKTLFENLENIEKFNKNLKVDLYRNYSTLANNFYFLKDYDNSIRFEKKAINVINNKLRYINASYMLIACCYIDLKKNNAATYYLNKILNNPKSKIVYPQNFYEAKSALSYVKLLKNETNKLLEGFNEVEDYYSRNENYIGQNYNQIYLSEYYAKVKDTSNSIKAAQKAFALSRSYKNPTDILYSLAQLIKVDKKNASINAREYIKINDSLQIAERRFRNKFAQIVYQTNEISKQKEIAIKQKWIIGTSAAIVILVITLLLIITKQQSKQKELQFQQSQQKANEEIYDLMLKQKSREEEARQNEKRRIAAELHDGVMNKLVSTRLNLNILFHRKDKETIKKCLIHIEAIRKIEQEIRNIAHNLNIDIFSPTNSFAELLNDFITMQNSTTSSNYILETDLTIDWANVSSVIKMNFYRIIQEASHNVNKYAQATYVIISLILDEKNICLSITDNGKGFDTTANSEGIGLKNIKQRVDSLNGKFLITSNNKSTCINISIPFNE